MGRIGGGEEKGEGEGEGEGKGREGRKRGVGVGSSGERFAQVVSTYVYVT